MAMQPSVMIDGFFCLSRRLCLLEITKDIRYIGVDDHDIDLFEGQYDVSENGMAYNLSLIHI